MVNCMNLGWGEAGWCLLILIRLIPSVKCQHIEYYDSGEKSDYFSQLDYQTDVDLPIYETTNAYGDDTKNQVSNGCEGEAPRSRMSYYPAYKLDFIAEEPVKRKSLAKDRYAAIDRMTGFYPKNKKSYILLPPLRDACLCNRHLNTHTPTHRRAYKRVPSSTHRRRHYKRSGQIEPDQIALNFSSNSRRKRDIYANGDLRRSNMKWNRARHPLHLMKLHRKKMSQRQREPIKRFVTTMRDQVKRFQRKPNLSVNFKRPRLAKRDIRPEYGLLEREKEQTDLTLPEIIQFMPETLQPNYRRGQCNIGCAAAIPKLLPPRMIEISHADVEDDQSGNYKTSADDEISNKSNEDKAPIYFYLVSPLRNTINKDSITAYTDTYHSDGNQHGSNGPHFSEEISSDSSDFGNDQYQQRAPRHIGNNRLEASPQFLFDDHVSPRQLITETNQWPNHWTNYPYQHHQNQQNFLESHLNLLKPSPPNTITPQYLGDFQKPEILQRTENYPSKEVLDRVIQGIVNRHPDFVEATVHRNGALVDPELLQIADTKDLIHKLIIGRLASWFGH